jgi:Ala-tRNA(Pro) deacylase
MGKEESTMTACKERLIAYLSENRVPFQTMKHHTAFTAQEVAAEQKVPGKQVAKVVIVTGASKMVMLVMPATYHIDFRKLNVVLGCQDARLAKEEEFQSLFPDCETGAMPPFGNLYDVPVYVDKSLTEDPAIVFNAGSHDETMKVPYVEYARLANPIVAEFALHL